MALVFLDPRARVFYPGCAAATPKHVASTSIPSAAPAATRRVKI
jgi:hypothetical protein